MRESARTDRVAAPAEDDRGEAPPRWSGLGAERRASYPVSGGGLELGIRSSRPLREERHGRSPELRPGGGPRPAPRVRGERRTRVRLPGTLSGDPVGREGPQHRARDGEEPVRDEAQGARP